ncbi:MAG TPA: serine/threonine-protein kinase [Bryobacteraceae bacterium]|nr:serine/threonine-protein kinase [Bryobacteraceae bacterium]
MTPERLRRIRDVFEAALEMGPEAREAFLERECQADGDLRKEVERLLGVREHLPEWLAGPLLGPAGPVLDAMAKAAPGMEGRDLRGYELIREIGRGGMGTVYLAERADGTYRKQVAIKIVHAEKNSREILERFRREREILASLDHPNIARLLDGGSTEEGLPYFVMEFVDGRPIHRFCDERKLNVGQRIELFRKVCTAVQYAHQHLVVHRDLKPANILVTADGTVKLLDFGIAKLLDTAPTGELPATVTIMRLMTPEYASPEQVMGGKAITTLSDVYSLGVVLYELLTGHRPYHLLSAAMHEVARKILEEEPTRPSDIVSTSEEGVAGERGKQLITPKAVSEVREGDPNRLRKRLQGDLDSILLTTLRKEPVRRYSSVEALSDDLRRHLDNLPVIAREDTFWYRADRFARRHPGGVTAGSMVALLLAAGLGTATWGARVALRAAQEILPSRAMTAPLMAMFLCCTLAQSVGSVYLTRAKSLRAAGALAGGLPVAAALMIGYRLGHSIGWWLSRFTRDATPKSQFSPVFFLSIALAGTAYLLVCWRVSRRFGWVGLTAFIVALSGLFALQDRFFWAPALNNVTVGIYPLVTDAALWAVGFVLGYAVMRLIAGPARDDPFARRS